MKKAYSFFLAGAISAGGFCATAEESTDITDLLLTNAGFDLNLNYDATYSGNVAGDLINDVFGWEKDMSTTYTVAGTFGYGSNATFNSSSKIPASGYEESEGGALALTTGWGSTLNYSQPIKLVKGKYSLISAYYNAGTYTVGSSCLGWIPESGTSATSKIKSFPVKQWITDQVDFTIEETTSGKIQIGFVSTNVTSGNNAKVLVDYVKLIYHGLDKTELSSVIAEAEALYGDGTGAYSSNLLETITKAKAVYDSEDSNMSDVIGYINLLNQEMFNYTLNNATPESPLDFTSYISNPSFESGFTGWENNGFATQSNNSFTLKKGTYYIEKWTNIGSKVADVSVAQTITGIPNGKYIVSAASGNIQQSGSGSTVNSGTTPQTGVVLFADYFEEKVNAFRNRSFECFVTNNQITIGIKAENATGNWVVCDNFKLEYIGNDIQGYADIVKAKIAELTEIGNKKMQNDVRSRLEEVLLKAQAAVDAASLDLNTLGLSMTDMIAVSEEVNISIAAFESLEAALEISKNIYGDGNGNDADIYKEVIDWADLVAINTAVELSELRDAVVKLEKADLAYRIANGSGTVPTVVTDKRFARGATKAYGRSTISGVTTSNLLEYGFCWSTEPGATVFDNKSTRYMSNNGRIFVLEELTPSTVYYARAYAISKTYAIGYGDEIKIITTPKGKITYTLNASVTNAAGHHERIAEAMSTAVDYWNNLTSIQGHHLSVNYNSGTPTAEASYGGYMQFGASSSYQKTGTAMHEMNHTVGVGQHSLWYGPNSPLRETGSRGNWLGERANAVVRFLDNNNSSVLTGDGTHMWPYGINGAQEDNGTELTYSGNALVTQALGEDGLPPTGGFATPSYTFPSDSQTKYYIKNESDKRGLYTSFIAENNGRIALKSLTTEEVLGNDSLAWYIEFDPTTAYYSIRNAETGKYFTYKSSGTNGMRLEEKTPSTNEYFQFMGAREDLSISSGSSSFSAKGYWIVRPQATLTPYCFGAPTTTSTNTIAFNFANNASTQRWLLLTAEQLLEFEKANPVVNSIYQIDTDESGIKINTCKGGIMISSQAEQNISLYTIDGKVITDIQVSVEPQFVALEKGFYIVGTTKIIVR